MKLTEKVTITREVAGPIKDLVMFALYLKNANLVEKVPDTDRLIQAAHAYWDTAHGED